MQVSSDSLGSYLRVEREQRGVSLQEISAVTKIQVRFLDALEEDAYEQLPPTPFVIGFLRAYAQCLSLAPDDIVMAYHQRHRVLATVEKSQPPMTPQMRQATHLGTVAVGVGIVVLGLLAVLVLRGLRAGEEARRTDSTTVVIHEQTATTGTAALLPIPAVSPTPPTPLRVPPAVPGQDSPAVPQAAAPPSEALAPLPRPLPQTTWPALQMPVVAQETTVEATVPPLVLQADAVEDTWLRVIIDDHTRYALLLKAGQNIRWQAEERFVLTVGNARGTRLQLNEHAVSLPPTGSNVVRDFVLTREVLN